MSQPYIDYLNTSHHVGLVKEKFFTYDQPFKMERGTLDDFTLAYETYGELNSSSNNAVLICHALTGDHHVAGIYAENDNACQEILKRYHEYGIMQGEFIKTILKIVAIANEIQEFCNLPSIQDIQLMNLCSQIPEKIMKNVATNQSLYVYTN